MNKFNIDLEKELNKELKQSNIKGLKAGFIKESKYSNGISVPKVAYIHNYGLGVPTRPFFNKAIINNAKKWDSFLENTLKQNNVNFSNILEKLGNIIVGDIQTSITELKDPPNKESTIKKKKSSNPLIDTGLMRKSVSYQVLKG